MSAGPFTNTFYETDKGFVVPIKVQPETLTTSFGSTPNGAGGTLAEDGFPSAQISKSKRAIGINARSVSVKVATATAPYANNTLLRIPVLDKAVYDGIAKFSAVTTVAGAGIVVGFQPESVV